MSVSGRTLLTVGGAIAIAAGVEYGRRKLSGPGGNIVEGRSRAIAVAGDEDFPDAVDVVIVGGGIVGVCVALFLAEKGVSVALCEKGAIAGEASGRAQGQVSSAGLDPSKLDLIAMSKELWSGFDERVGGSVGYSQSGLISPCTDLETLGFWEEWLASTSGKVPHARILSAIETGEILPSSKRWIGAFYDSSDGGAEPTLSAPAIAEGARKRGAKILLPCAVRGVETSGGITSAVVTERGPIRTSTVILAGGCWSSKFLHNLGIKFPAISMFSSLARVSMENPPKEMPGNFDVDGAVVRRHMDGTFSLGATKGRIPITPELIAHGRRFAHVAKNPPFAVSPHLGSYFLSELRAPRRWSLEETSPFELNRILEPSLNDEVTEEVRATVRTAFPQFGSIKVEERWSGALTVLPDNVPVLDKAPGLDGLYLATGFTYGITMGPAAAKLIAQLVMGDDPDLDMTMYRYSRLIDGSQLRFTH